MVDEKGNVARHTQATVDAAPFRSLTASTAASQRPLIAGATPSLTPCVLNPNNTLVVYRTRRVVWSAERTLVVLLPPRLQQGQRRSIARKRSREWTSGERGWRADASAARMRRSRPRSRRGSAGSTCAMC